MKKAILGAALVVLSAAAQCATHVAAPLGLELGRATCSKLSAGENDAKGASGWAGGPTFTTQDVGRYHIPGLARVTINCDAKDKVALVSLTFNKGAGAKTLRDVESELDGKFVSTRKQLPGSGNGYAEWMAVNGSLEMIYAPDNPQFLVAYWAAGAKEKYFAYSAIKGRKPAPEQRGRL